MVRRSAGVCVMQRGRGEERVAAGRIHGSDVRRRVRRQDVHGRRPVLGRAVVPQRTHQLRREAPARHVRRSRTAGQQTIRYDTIRAVELGFKN